MGLNDGYASAKLSRPDRSNIAPWPCTKNGDMFWGIHEDIGLSPNE
jgi:hypothetical protein